MKRLTYFFLVLSVFLVSFISANGLQVSPVSITINKSENLNYVYNITICNTESNDFQDIKFEDNSLIQISSMNLSSGQCINASANIIANQDFTGSIRLKGFYVSDLGQQNVTRTLSVDYVNGLSACDFSIIMGDTIIWNNLVSGQINLINADTLGLVSTLNQNGSYSNTFYTPTEFRYYFTRLGLRFTDICTISALDTQGLINNPELDFLLNLNIDISYIPTDLIINVFNDNYTIIPGQKAQDILNIRNNGNNTARNIYLSGNWITFTTNGFDLAPGESRNVGYDIFPILMNTSQTNQTYKINLSILGNFNSFYKIININIPFTEITSNIYENSATLEQLAKERIEFILAYCQDNPNNADCSKIMKKYVNLYNNTGTAQDEFTKALILFMDDETTYRNLQKMMLDNVINSSQSTENKTDEALNKIANLENNNETYRTAVWALVIIIIVGLIIITMFFIFKGLKSKKTENKFEVYH